MDAIEEVMERCEILIERINRTSSASISPSCKKTLLRLANAELAFLTRRASVASVHNSPLRHYCANIGHLEVVLHVLDWPFVSAVSRVCKSIPFMPLSPNAKRNLSNPTNVHVDIVCSLGGQPAWIVVSDKNPKYVLWNGSKKNKGLQLRIEEVLKAACSSQMPRPASVVLFFSRGVTESILEKISNDFSVGVCTDVPRQQSVKVSN